MKLRALKLKLHQHNAVYRNPSSGEIVESYPLVPPSTILGMISSVLKKQDLASGIFNLGIQGIYGGLIRDYQWHKKYDIDTDGYKSRRYPLLVHTLFDVALLIHIYSIDSTTLSELLGLFRNPPYFLYLGRAEDIIKIDEFRIVEIRKNKIAESHTFPLNAYISARDANTLKRGGVFYRLPSYSKLVPLKIKKYTKLIRDFEWADVVFVERGARIELDEDSEFKCWFDGENVIWWCLPNPPQ